MIEWLVALSVAMELSGLKCLVVFSRSLLLSSDTYLMVGIVAFALSVCCIVLAMSLVLIIHSISCDVFGTLE